MKALIFILLAAPVAAFGQEHRWQITPAVGLADGGRIRVDDSQLTDGFESVDIVRGDSLGLRLGRRLSRHPEMMLDLEVTRQKTQLEDNRRLFGETPGGPLPQGSIVALDTHLTHLHAGLSWNWRGETSPATRTRGAIQPFLAASAGLTHIGFTAPLDSTTAPSVAAGIGSNVWLSRNIALRIHARGMFIASGVGSGNSVPITNRDCTGECIRRYEYADFITQAQVTLGLTWGFDDIPYVNDFRSRASGGDDAENP